jgi:transcriptional regulator with XRE-family HTH domain
MTPAELLTARERLCMTQKELAEAIGRHVNTVARYERGELAIPKIVAVLLAQLT